MPLVFILAYTFVAISIALLNLLKGEVNAAVMGSVVMAVFAVFILLLNQLKTITVYNFTFNLPQWIFHIS